MYKKSVRKCNYVKALQEREIKKKRGIYDIKKNTFFLLKNYQIKSLTPSFAIGGRKTLTYKIGRWIPSYK